LVFIRRFIMSHPRNRNKPAVFGHIDVNPTRTRAAAEQGVIPRDGAVADVVEEIQPKFPKRQVLTEAGGWSKVLTRRSALREAAAPGDRDSQSQQPPQKGINLEAVFPPLVPLEEGAFKPGSSGTFHPLATLDGGVIHYARTKQSAKKATGSSPKAPAAQQGSGEGASAPSSGDQSPALGGAADPNAPPSGSDSGDSHLALPKGSSKVSLAQKAASTKRKRATKETHFVRRDGSIAGPDALKPAEPAPQAPTTPAQQGESEAETPSPLISSLRRGRVEKASLAEQMFHKHATEIDGSCLFDALYCSLKTREDLSGWQYPLCRLDSRRQLRDDLCNTVAAERRVPQLGDGLTPEQAVMMDYISTETPLRDPAYEAEALRRGEANPLQLVNTFDEYIQAMRSPTASGDEIMIAACARKFKVRIVVLGRRSRLDDCVCRWHVQGDYHPPLVPLDRYIILIHLPGHFEWAHPASFNCPDYGCGCDGSAISTRLSVVLPQWQGGLPKSQVLSAEERFKRDEARAFTEMESWAAALVEEAKDEGRALSVHTATAALWLTRKANGRPDIDTARRLIPGAGGNPIHVDETPERSAAGGSAVKRGRSNTHEQAGGAARKEGAAKGGAACKISSGGKGDDDDSPSEDEDDDESGAESNGSACRSVRFDNDDEEDPNSPPPATRHTYNGGAGATRGGGAASNRGSKGGSDANTRNDGPKQDGGAARRERKLAEQRKRHQRRKTGDSEEESEAEGDREFEQLFDDEVTAGSQCDGGAQCGRNHHHTHAHTAAAGPETFGHQPGATASSPWNSQLVEELQAREAAVRVCVQITGAPEEIVRKDLNTHLIYTNSMEEAVTACCRTLHPHARALTFVEQHLGEGVRTPTVAELAHHQATGEVPEPLRPTALRQLFTEAAAPQGAYSNLTAHERAHATRNRVDRALHDQALRNCAASRDLNRSLVEPLRAARDEDLDAMTAPSAAFLTPQHSHPSPSVRVAARAAAATQSANPQGSTVVVVTGGGGKLPHWKSGPEASQQGFYWSTKEYIQHHWRQYMAGEGQYAPKTFKSLIDITMIPTICAETGISEHDWDTVKDVELLEKIEACLQPKNSTDFLIKLRQIKISTDETKGSLSQRYRVFAEAFLHKLAEARNSSRPVGEQAIKITFIAALRIIPPLEAKLLEERWIDLPTAHRRIVECLKEYDTWAGWGSIGGTTATSPQQPANPAPPLAQEQQQQQQQPRIPPPPRQQQQRGWGRQEQQQQAMVNALQQAFPALANNMQPAGGQQQQQPQQQQQQQRNQNFRQQGPPYVHPGLDARGPNWHRPDSCVRCREENCQAEFCQLCGQHGHTAADCRKRGRMQGLNLQGYWSENRANQPAVRYLAPPPGATAQQQIQQRYPHFVNNTSGAAPAPQNPQNPVPAPAQAHESSHNTAHRTDGGGQVNNTAAQGGSNQQ